MADPGDSGPESKGVDARGATEISSAGTRGELAANREAPDTIDPLIGRTIAERYRIIGLLGRGGMGAVYLCEHVQLGKRMALKILAEELQRKPALVQRFLQEARAAAKIGHPNIVDVFDLGELPGGGAYIAMALLEGEDLDALLYREGPLPFFRVRPIVGQLCRALAAVHAKGIVHRDMKPANVFLTRDADGSEVVKVLDFGIAQVSESAEGAAARLTQTGAIIGTPAFMSPEQGRGDRPDHRTDIYSVGCILYALLTGKVPFEASTLMGVVTKHLFEPPQPPSERAPPGAIAPELDALVLRAMAKQPEERFQTMKELWEALEACATEAPQAWPDAISGRYPKLPPATSSFPRPGTPAPAAVALDRPPSAAPVTTAAPADGSIAADAAAGASASNLVRPPSPRRALSGALIAGAVVAVLGVAAIAVSMRPRPQVPGMNPGKLAPAATAPVSVPAPVAVAEVALELRSDPPGATVWAEDKALGKTPLDLVRPRGEARLSLRVTLPDHLDQTVEVGLDRDRKIKLSLQPITHPPSPSNPSLERKPPRHAPPSVRTTGRDGKLKDPFAK